MVPLSLTPRREYEARLADLQEQFGQEQSNKEQLKQMLNRLQEERDEQLSVAKLKLQEDRDLQKSLGVAQVKIVSSIEIPPLIYALAFCTVG